MVELQSCKHFLKNCEKLTGQLIWIDQIVSVFKTVDIRCKTLVFIQFPRCVWASSVLEKVWEMKFVIYCLVIYAAEIQLYVSATNNAFDDGEACLVQYLQGKGKLDSNFISAEKPSPNCFLVMPLTKMVVRKTFTDRIEKEIPDHSECLISKFDGQETLDLLIKISVIQSSSDEYAELELTRNALHEDLKNIMSHCESNDETFVIIFNDYLGNKNGTLEVLQQDYCMSKYVADNKFLNLNNIDLNPSRVDITDLDCNQIVEKQRLDAEKELTDKIATIPNGQRISKCVVDAYKNGEIFDAGIALKVLYTLDVPKELKESEKVRWTQKLSDFGFATFTCT